MCGGTERWSQKVLVDAAVSTINFTPIASNVAYMVGITAPILKIIFYASNTQQNKYN